MSSPAYPLPGMTTSLPALCSAANAAAAGLQASDGSSENASESAALTASVGRSRRYTGSSTGARTESASMPPARKTETRIGLSGDCRSAACATPSASACPPSPSRPAPYTEARPPAAPSRKRRRSIPVPAGIGIDGSHSRGPWDAVEAAARRAAARV